MPADAKLNDNAMIHLYRGELARMTAYRVRLDTTTNWALGANAALLSLGLGGSPDALPLFSLAVLLNLGFVWMEARRFRGFELIRKRVRLLETGYFLPQLRGDASVDLPGEWRQELAESLRNPRPSVSYLQAASDRLRRNFLMLIALDYAGWLFMIHRQGGLPEGAATLGMPGTVVLLLAALFFVVLIGLARYYRLPEEG